MLRKFPLLYVKHVQLVLPGMTGWQLPAQQILIDYNNGELKIYTPLMFQGLGYASVFPEGMPVDVTLGWGYLAAVNPTTAPAWTSQDVSVSGGPGLTPGDYYIAVTAATMWGETTAVPQLVTTASGAIQITITPTLGAYLYRVYIQQTTSMGLTFVIDSPATTYAQTPLQVTVQSTVPATGIYPDALPMEDTTPPLHDEIITALEEATRLRALSMLVEQNSLANRGIIDMKAGGKSTTWMNTSGRSGRGKSYWDAAIEDLITPLKSQEIF